MSYDVSYDPFGAVAASPGEGFGDGRGVALKPKNRGGSSRRNPVFSEPQMPEGNPQNLTTYLTTKQKRKHPISGVPT